MRCSGRGPPRGRRSTSRRRRLYRRNGLARQRGSPASRGSEPNRRAQRGYTLRSGPRMAASSASTQLRPSLPDRAGLLLRLNPNDAAPPPSRSETRHQLRSPDWATMRPSFALRRFTESRERQRSMARGPRATITHGDARESIASRGSGTTVAWSWPSTLRRADSTSSRGTPAKRDGPRQSAGPPSGPLAMNQIGTNASAAPLQAAWLCIEPLPLGLASMSPCRSGPYLYDLCLFRDQRRDGPPAALSEIASLLQATEKGRNL